MPKRGAGLAIAVAALLAGCGNASEPSPPRPQEPAAARAAPALRPPVDASPAAPASVAAEPTPPPEPSASPSPEAPLKRYAPADECAKLPGFATFRDKLFAAVKGKDADALVALADPGVHLDYGGGAGRDELKKRLTAADTSLWGELGDLASLGCAADKGVATLPWIFARVPESADPYKTMWVIGADVPLREKPRAGAAVRRPLDWALVDIVGSGFDPKVPYTEVSAGGVRGFVETARLRSIVDYRVIADRGEGGEWRITAFIAGD